MELPLSHERRKYLLSFRKIVTQFIFVFYPYTGPALWAYNDAVFTDDDFENITKLSGATKEPKTDKIGRLVLRDALFLARLALTDLSGLMTYLRFRIR